MVAINENISFIDYASGIRLPDCFKLAMKRKNDNDVITSRHYINVKILWRDFVSLVKSSYCSRFHVNIITGFGVMTVFFYKGLTRNPEIGNITGNITTNLSVLPNAWRLGQDRNIKFDTNVSNKMLLNTEKC